MIRYQFMRFPEGKPKAVTFSYDDGARTDIPFLRILDKYDLKCTINYTQCGTNKISKEEIAENILRKGHEIAIHGWNHRAEGVLRPIEGIQDVLNCRLALEEAHGIIIRGMAYPDSGITRFTNGASYESVKQYLKELDIAYARTLGGDNNSFSLPSDWYAWMPTAHHSNSHIFEYIEEFLKINTDKIYASNRNPRLFYIWGHSFEFENQNNWERLEQICQKLAHKEDTWYATNMEIYNYVTAYQSLVYSADGKMVYNPSRYTVWFDVDTEMYAVRSGETIRIK